MNKHDRFARDRKINEIGFWMIPVSIFLIFIHPILPLVVSLIGCGMALYDSGAWLE